MKENTVFDTSKRRTTVNHLRARNGNGFYGNEEGKQESKHLDFDYNPQGLTMKTLLSILLLFVASTSVAEEFPLQRPTTFQKNAIMFYEMTIRKQIDRVNAGVMTKEQANQQINEGIQDLRSCIVLRMFQRDAIRIENGEDDQLARTLNGLMMMNVGHYLYLSTALENAFGSSIISRQHLWDQYIAERENKAHVLVDLYQQKMNNNQEADATLRTINTKCQQVEKTLSAIDVAVQTFMKQQGNTE